MPSIQSCAACASERLDLRLRVTAPADPTMTSTTDHYGAALSDLVRCRDCRHMQLRVMPTAQTLADAYAAAQSTDYLEEEVGQRATAHRVLRQIAPHVAGWAGRPPRILDLGCWVGFLLDEARRCGWDGIGVEQSEFAAAHARERLGLDVRTGDLMTEPLPPQAFDAVVLADVLEHLPQPGEAVQRIAGLLAPGGVLALTLPDSGSPVARALARRWWSIVPTHVQYFTRGSVTTLLGRHGLTVLSTTTQPKTFSVRYYLSRLRGYSPTAARGLVRVAEATQLADRPWAPDFRDRMLVIARGPFD